MERIAEILEAIKEFILSIAAAFDSVSQLSEEAGWRYTSAARWIFILLAVFIVARSVYSLFAGRRSPEVFAYFNINGEENYPITHWENAVGRSKRCDLTVEDQGVSRTQGTLTRDDEGRWKYTDVGSKNGTLVGDRLLNEGESAYVEPGDEIVMGRSICTLFPISIEERRNNFLMRKEETLLLKPWLALIALTIFQLMTVVQLRFSLGEEYVAWITVSFVCLSLAMWIYVLSMRMLRRRGFEMETLAFFLSTLSLAVTASKYPEAVFKQFVAIMIGLFLFVFMCAFLRNLDRTKKMRPFMYVASAALFILNLVLGITVFGATNWISIGGITVQPSEIVKLAFIWVGAATMDELMSQKKLLIFTGFAGFCFVCLALMGDFGTASIFFVSFLVISFLRSGDFTKLIAIVGVAVVGGMMVLRFKGYIANRFAAWGHVWEFADDAGYQQTRTMSAAAGGGMVGLGAGNGWLKNIGASETDLVFGFVAEEWGLIIALLTVAAIITLSIFAVRSIWAGRSTYYTIAACSAMSLFLFQTMLNVFGSIDLFPLTGVTFPFLSVGGTSMVSSWGMLAFLKAADTRLNASLAVKGGIKRRDLRSTERELEREEEMEVDYA